MASYPASTTFCFSPGRYAVTATIVPQAGDRLIGQPGTIFDAGIPVTGWHLLGGIWAAPAPRAAPTFDYGGGYGGSYQFPQAVFADDVFEDDRPLIKAGVAYQGNVIGTPPSSLSRGQYFYDYDRQLIEMAADPSGHAVELVGLPDGVIHSYNAGVTIRGLTVQGSLGDGIVTGSGSGWRVEGNDVRLNHSEGVRVTTGALVTGNFIHDNGTYGIAASGDAMRFTGNEVARNDTSLYRMGDGECSDAGGSKITLSSNVVMDRNWYYENHCIGLWFDIDNSGVSILYNHVDRNYENGIDYEISYDAQIRGNEVSGSPHWAILDSASPNVTITANVVTSEGDGGIIINQGPRTDWPSTYGPHDAVHIEVHANRIRMRSGRCGAQQYGVAGTPFDGMAFSSTNRFYDNRYVLQNMTGRWFEWASGPVTIAGWRSLGQDAGSTFSRG